MLSFEFDEQKSQSNREKHGMDFIQAQELWKDQFFIEIPAKTVDETWFVVIGRIKRKHWSAVVTRRVERFESFLFDVLALKRLLSMKAKKIDSEFDSGKDVTAVLDVSKARRPLQKQKTVNVDFPDWMIESLDREAGRLGVTRQSIIIVWIAERLEQSASNK